MKRRVTTRGGWQILIREAAPADAATTVHMIDVIAREEVYFLRSRFLMSKENERTFISEATRRGDGFLVAEHEGELVGWISLERGRAEFTRHAADLGLGVLPEYRGLGIGTALLTCALDWARENRIEKLTLRVRASNSRAIQLYRGMGFVPEGRRLRQIKDNRGRYDDDILMGRFLA